MAANRELGLTLDQGALFVAKKTREYLADPDPPAELFFAQVFNTDDARSSGYHWFTVVFRLARRA